MKRILVIVYILGSVLLVEAQQDTLSFGLNDCMAYAVENATSMRNAQLDEQSADSRVKETVGLGLPQISANATLQHSPDLRRFFSENTGNGGFADLSEINGIEVGDVYAIENVFSLPSSGDVGLSLNQLIFNGSYFVGIQASKAYKELSVKRKDKAQGDIKSDVAKAYFNLLINKDRLELYDANLTRLDTLYSNTVKLYEQGFAEQVDVNRLKVALNNAKSEKGNLENLVILSERLLKFQMNYPVNDPIEITGTIDDVLERAKADIDDEIVYGERPDYQVLLANQRLQELNLKNKYAEALPTINFFANVGLSTQSPNISGLFRTNSDFEETSSVGRDSWYNYSVIGLSMRWNLFTGLQRHHQVQQQKIELKKIENNLDQFESMIHVEVREARLTFNNAKERLQDNIENIALAEDVLRVAKVKYEEGVGSNFELVDADNSLKQAQTNYYNTLFETIISKIDLHRSLGKDENE